MSKHSPAHSMDAHTLDLLDFPLIVEALKERCLSEAGRQELDRQVISTDPDEVERRKQLAVSFRRLLESGRAFPTLDFPDVSALERKLFKRGIQFEVEELFYLGRFIISARRLRKHLRDSGEPLLIEPASELHELKELSREIFSVIDKDGSLRVSQIPVLREIRDRIRALQRETQALAKSYLGNPAYRSLWQADLPAEKNGRTVLPIKSNFKGRIPGIIHDVSTSGSTLYLEPAEMVEKNNTITEEENRFRREVHRILRELGAKVTGHSDEIQSLIQGVARLDTLYARALYAIQHRSAPAQEVSARGQGNRLSLFDARHPLLGKRCVPITVLLGGDYRVLIVTGPNTGGKTVTLKTVGLLAAMNQFGMEIPAREDSSLSVFDNILADIGDEQSIEQSLSTFSAHIVNIARIIGHSSSRSLVLFDELGAGTDPEEGVAIAMALLDHFIETGSLCLATTHHGILKNYGYSRRGVENAAMEFDVEELRPTFRIIIGIPGESHALEVARRGGIPEQVLNTAGQYLKEERGDTAELVASLSEKQRRLLAAEQQQRSRESELREKTRQTDLKELRLRQKELELREQGVAELRRFLKESRQRYEQLVRGLRNLGEEEERRQAREFLRELAEGIARRERALEGERGELYRSPEPALEQGMEVIIRGTGRRGKLVRKQKGERWLVATETLRGTFPVEELIPAQSAPEEPVLSIREEVQSAPAAYQLDVRGMRLEEALARLEQQIDRALVSGLTEFSIVHGLGEGVLQRGIHDFLKNSPQVKDYHFSAPEQGGFGRTVVRL
jgi:DNA mismatch repair protein MutS2